MNRAGSPQRITTALSAVAVAAGVVIAVVASASSAASQAASFGWFAYQPLAEAAFYPGSGSVVVLTPMALLGITLAGLGLLGLAFVWGMRVGARRLRRDRAKGMPG